MLEAAAVSMPGFIGAEYRTCEDGKRNNATCYWANLESLQLLAVHPQHVKAERRCVEWHKGYQMAISEVIHSYDDGASAHPTRRPRQGL